MTRGDSNGSDDEDRENDTGSGGPEIHVGFSLSLGGVFGGLLPGRSGSRRGLGRRPGTVRTERSPSGKREDGGTVDSHVETYRDGDRLTVVADLPDIEFEDVAAGLGEETGDLVIRVDEAVVERVPVPFDPVEATAATFNNGVLEVRLRAVGSRTA